jgi:hypothetical protein
VGISLSFSAEPRRTAWPRAAPAAGGTPAPTTLRVARVNFVYCPKEVITMFRVAFAAILLGSLTVSAVAAPPARQVFKGRIMDVRGVWGTLTLTTGEGQQAKDRTFQIQEARILSSDGVEQKVGYLREGQRVEVEMAPGGRLVQEVRVLPGGRTR